MSMAIHVHGCHISFYNWHLARRRFLRGGGGIWRYTWRTWSDGRSDDLDIVSGIENRQMLKNRHYNFNIIYTTLYLQYEIKPIGCVYANSCWPLIGWASDRRDGGEFWRGLAVDSLELSSTSQLSCNFSKLFLEDFFWKYCHDLTHSVVYDHLHLQQFITIYPVLPFQSSHKG